MDVFEKTAWEGDLEDLILQSPAPGKHSARSALRHIAKAWALARLDPEMAAFRAITAEEESATAVFHAVRRRKYKGWKKLNPWNHVQKNALSPFITAVGELFEHADKQLDLKPELIVDKTQEHPSLQVRFNVRKLIPGQTYALPEPPLHFSVSQDGVIHDFSNQLEKLAKSKNCDTIVKHLKDRANKRNHLLYASAEGIPTISAMNNFLPAQRRIVNMNLAIYLLIDPYPEHQLFVEQALRAFLIMLDLVPAEIEFQ